MSRCLKPLLMALLTGVLTPFDRRTGKTSKKNSVGCMGCGLEDLALTILPAFYGSNAVGTSWAIYSGFQSRQ